MSVLLCGWSHLTQLDIEQRPADMLDGRLFNDAFAPGCVINPS